MKPPKKPASGGPTPSLTLVVKKPTPRKTLTAKEEALAVDIASGMDHAAALRKTYTWNGKADGAHREAAQILRRPHVATRLQALRDQYATKVVEASRGLPAVEAARAFGVKEAMDEIDEMVTVARAKENPMAMGKAIELRMKLYGLGVSDAKNPADKDELPPEELEKLLDELQTLKERKRG